MQFCDLECLGRCGAAAELERLVAREFLLPEDAARVRLDEIELFRRSALFARLRGATVVRRELRFHALLCADRFTADEELRRALAGRELLVQGVIDCILEEGQDYILIDYKTDRLSERELLDPALAARRLSERHALQLAYYAAACERMYGKPPREMLIYSLPLGDTVPVSLPPRV
jgi:ATP-dependent helicase/nuclease subunit A